jgi:hypothetical protein
MKLSFGIALGALALLAQSAAAQGACDDLKSFFAKPPKIGEWAELTSEAKSGKEAQVTRVAFVGKEQRNGRDLYRIQMTMNVKGQRQIMQSLTPWDISALSPGQDYDNEIVVKQGDNPAMSMPVKADQKRNAVAELQKNCAKVKYVGEETMAVPAGSFKARHYADEDGDSWFSPDAPGYRLVKMVTKDGKTISLTAVGTGAKNEITEKPMDMKAMMSNPEAMKKMMEGQKGESNK